MEPAKTNPNNYELQFIELYSLAKKFSEEHHLDLEEIFDCVVKLHDPKNTSDDIKAALRNYKGSKKFLGKGIRSYYDTWLIFGETGQGKSTFINSLCTTPVAEEGNGIKSKTTCVSLYPNNSNSLLLVDTPGLFDTRNITNEDISKKIADQVKERLKVNANIKSIMLLWCPNFSLKLRLDEMLAALEKALGPHVIDSVIFLVNKVTSKWTSEYDEANEEFKEELKAKNLTNPVVLLDVKTMDKDNIGRLKQLSSSVKPFKEEYFEEYRLDCLHEKYLKVKKEDEEKEREKERIKKELQAEQDKKLQKELQEYKDRVKALESRPQQHPVQQIYQPPVMTYSPPVNYSPSYSQNVSYQVSHNTSVSSIRSTPSYSGSTGNKFYKGGQFTPGGGRAPSGGVYMRPSGGSTSYHSGGGTFYKGGQFLPGGGRAPRGGAYR